MQTYLYKQSEKINRALLSVLPKENEHPASLSEAMRYAVLSGGKRLRPILALAACEAVGGSQFEVMDAALALELIHNYSLVHDDLPCMDNDATRRGKPTCHAKFGEVTALLAGDALLTRAFQVLSRKTEDGGRRVNDGGRRMEDPSSPRLRRAGGGQRTEDGKRLRCIYWISEAVGYQGMVGGQHLDMEYGQKEVDLPTIEYINTHKSGALIAVCLKVGAYLGGGTPDQVESLYRYGKTVGLLFQIVDDIMDEQGYALVVGIHEAREEASKLLDQAKRELSSFGEKGRLLKQIADNIMTRKN